MRRVRCPRCSTVILTAGAEVICHRCGLVGRVESRAQAGPPDRRPTRKQRREARRRAAAAPSAVPAAAAGGMRDGTGVGAFGSARGEAWDARGDPPYAMGAPHTHAPAPRPAQRAKRDPWTITIDLRSLSPMRWSGGAKAFSMFLLVAFAFVAGGVSGVVFERARSEVADDLDDAGFFGSRSNDAGGDGGTQPGGQNGAFDTGDGSGLGPGEGAGQGTGDDTSGDTSDNGSSNTSGNGTSNTAGDGSGNGSGDPDPGAGTAGSGSDPIAFSGTGAWASEPFQLPAGLVRFTITHHGDKGTLWAKIMPEGQSTGSPAAAAYASDSGAFTTTRYDGLAAAGSYQLRVQGQDIGNWEIDVEVVGQESTSTGPFQLSGNGDGGLGPFRFNGEMSVSFSTTTSYAFDVTAFRADGSTITSCSMRGTTGGSGTCTFAQQTLVYFDIQIPKGGANSWQLHASSAE